MYYVLQMEDRYCYVHQDMEQNQGYFVYKRQRSMEGITVHNNYNYSIALIL